MTSWISKIIALLFLLALAYGGAMIAKLFLPHPWYWCGTLLPLIVLIALGSTQKEKISTITNKNGNKSTL